MTVIDATSYSGILKKVKRSFKNLPINTKAGGKINRLFNQAYETERQGIQPDLTCIMTFIETTSYSDSLKQVK